MAAVSFTRKFSCCKAADNHNQYRADILKDCSRSRIGIGDCFHISQLTHHNAGNGKNKKTKPQCFGSSRLPSYILSVGKKTEAGEDKTGREEPCGCQIEASAPNRSKIYCPQVPENPHKTAAVIVMIMPFSFFHNLSPGFLSKISENHYNG